VDGAALDASDVAPPSGRPPPIVIGKEMATELGARVGDRVTVTIQPAKNEKGEATAMRTGAFLVKGIYATGVLDVDAHVVLVPLASLQQLAGVGKGVTMVAVLLHETRRTAEATSGLAARLAGTPDEVLPWQKAAPELYAAIVIDEGGMYVMMAIVYIVVAAGILNTILLSVLERTREFGVLLALGMPPSRIGAIVMTESAVLGVASIAVGLVLGLLGNHRLETHGLSLDVGHMEASGVLLPSHFYSDLAPHKVVWSALAVLTIVLVSALYPALRAGRLQPVEAMHHA
jgi:ABC-type lipoprotein release transport system permease subunit